MAAPDIKIIAVSNVFCRLMNFNNVGDIEQGHTHAYDHTTLISAGAVVVDVLNDRAEVISSKVFNAPSMVFIHKDKRHRLTALEKNTVCTCIHALRDIEDNILDPDFFIEPIVSNGNGELAKAVEQNHTTAMKLFTLVNTK